MTCCSIRKHRIVLSQLSKSQRVAMAMVIPAIPWTPPTPLTGTTIRKYRVKQIVNTWLPVAISMMMDGDDMMVLVKHLEQMSLVFQQTIIIIVSVSSGPVRLNYSPEFRIIWWTEYYWYFMLLRNQESAPGDILPFLSAWPHFDFDF